MPTTVLYRTPIHYKPSESLSSRSKALKPVLMCNIWRLRNVDGASDMERPTCSCCQGLHPLYFIGNLVPPSITIIMMVEQSKLCRWKSQIERLFHEKRYYVLVSDVFKIQQCIMEGGGYCHTFVGWKSRIIYIRMAEACLGAAYCNGDDVTSRYEAEELNKLRNPSHRCLH